MDIESYRYPSDQGKGAASPSLVEMRPRWAVLTDYLDIWCLSLSKHMLHPVVWFAFVIIGLYGLAVLNPLVTKMVLAELKRRWRLHLIQKGGEKEAKAFLRELRDKALADGFDQKLVDEVLSERKQEIVGRLSTRVANKSLGEPTPLELCF